MVAAIKEAEGFLWVAAQKLGCSAKTVERYIKKYPAVAEARREAKFKRDDLVEAKIMTRIKEGSDTMIIFYAKTQMKDRGYVERAELQHDGQLNVVGMTLDEWRKEQGKRYASAVEIMNTFDDEAA